MSAIRAMVPFTPFEADLKELVFETWLFIADRSPTRTLKVLEKQLHEHADDDDLPISLANLPSLRTIQHWIKHDSWDERANDKIRSTAKHIDETQISRMFIISDLALSFAHQLLEEGFNKNDNAGILAVKWDAAKEMLRFRGLGTAGNVGTPSLEIKLTDTREEMKHLSLEERSEMFREGMLRNKQQRRLTGHSTDHKK